MNQNVEKPLSAEEDSKRFDEHLAALKRKMHENGSLVVEGKYGQQSIDLGIEIPIDEIIPPSKEEIEWMMRP